MIANEYPWPPTHGGRKRIAKIAEALAEHVDLMVTSAPPALGFDGHSRPPSVRWCPLSVEPVPRWEQLTRWNEPFVGRRLIRGAAPTLQALAERLRPDVVYWSHSYLPAVRPNPFAGMNIQQVVEFPNIEKTRFTSMASAGGPAQRLSAALEAVKATRWEANVARAADAVVSLNQCEADQLALLNDNVIVALNGFDPISYVPSGDDATILSVGSWGYRPNFEAMERFLRFQWPRLVKARPDAVLRIVGRGAERFGGRSAGVECVGFVEDVEREYQRSSVVLAPASTGAGSQLKVAEAWSHGRLVVGPSFVRREARPDVPPEALRADNDVAGALLDVLALGAVRRSIEREVVEACAVASWSTVGKELARELDEMSSKGEI